MLCFLMWWGVFIREVGLHFVTFTLPAVLIATVVLRFLGWKTINGPLMVWSMLLMAVFGFQHTWWKYQGFCWVMPTRRWLVQRSLLGGLSHATAFGLGLVVIQRLIMTAWWWTLVVLGLWLSFLVISCALNTPFVQPSPEIERDREDDGDWNV